MVSVHSPTPTTNRQTVSSEKQALPILQLGSFRLFGTLGERLSFSKEFLFHYLVPGRLRFVAAVTNEREALEDFARSTPDD